jgi:hypothetical protein
MIISDKYKCIFIRIPKTGSTTVENLLIAADPDCISSDNSTPPYGHFGPNSVRAMAGEERWNSYFKFTFVRNPYTWFLSSYADHMKYQLDDVWGVHEILQENHALPEPWDGTINGAKAFAHASMMQFWHHGGYLGDKHEKMVTQSAWVPDDIDFVGKLEDFDVDMAVAANAIGMALEKKPEKENRSFSERLKLDDEAKLLISALYHADFLRFGYDFR